MEVARTLLSEGHLWGAVAVIFVTVGNATQGFRRLLDAVDRLAGAGAFDGEEVFIQSGNNQDFRPLNCKTEPFLAMRDFVLKIEQADVVVCHAGAGTLLQVFQAGKIPVVVPRKAYREHVDDHQLELTEALAAEGRVIPAYESEYLPAAIAEARQRRALPLRAPSMMLNLVAAAIAELAGPRR